MITQHGPNCDACGNYILPMINESINPFRVKGLEQELHACDNCAQIVKDAFAKQDWTLLPHGRLRECFETHYEKKAQGGEK